MKTLLLIAAIFKVLPDAVVRWRDVAIDATLTAALLLLGKYAVGLYLGGTRLGSSFGAAGSLAMLLLWVYFSAMILLLGAEFTVAWATLLGRPIKPQKGAVLVEPLAVRTSELSAAGVGR